MLSSKMKRSDCHCLTAGIAILFFKQPPNIQSEHRNEVEYYYSRLESLDHSVVLQLVLNDFHLSIMSCSNQQCFAINILILQKGSQCTLL